jgi:hypothetical protein
VRAVNRGDEIRQLVLGERSLDQREEDTFLVANVGMEPFTKLVQLFGWRRRVGGEIGRAAAKVDVVDEHANDRVVLGRAAASEGRQQDLFLDTEVLMALLIPEREERLTRSRSGLPGGAAQSLGYDQTMVVIARELGECVAALHPCREELPESEEVSVVWRRRACLATAGSAK